MSSDGYTLSDVDTAERRIRAACPSALVYRWNFDFSLEVARANKSAAYIVFHHEAGRRPIIGDVDSIIGWLLS